MLKVACNKKELSCLISNIFEYLLPVCDICENRLVIKGKLTGLESVATIEIKDYGFDYTGDPGFLEALRNRRCIYEPINTTTES